MMILQEERYSICAKTSTQSWPKLIVLLRSTIRRVRKLFKAGYLVFKNPTTLLRRTRLKSMNWWLRLVSFSVLTLFDSNTCESVAVFYIQEMADADKDIYRQLNAKQHELIDAKWEEVNKEIIAGKTGERRYGGLDIQQPFDAAQDDNVTIS